MRRELGHCLHGVDELGHEEHAPETGDNDHKASEVGQRVEVTKTNCGHSNYYQPEAIPHVVIVKVL